MSRLRRYKPNLCLYLFGLGKFWFTYCLIPTILVFAQIFNPTAELAIPKETSANEVNPRIETQLLTAETKTRKYSK